MNKVIDKIIGIRNRKKKTSSLGLTVEEKPEVQKGKRVKNTVIPEQLPITEVNPDLQAETEEVQTETKPRRNRTSTTSN